jgi:hypothetical protein
MICVLAYSIRKKMNRGYIMNSEITSDSGLVAACGLYCGACKAYRKGSCKGCSSHDNKHWCKILRCCRQHGYTSCAECVIVDDLHDCRLFNNMIGKLFSLLFNSDRFACIETVRNLGYEKYADLMASQGRQSFKRGTRQS